jgi:hypothetical protein
MANEPTLTEERLSEIRSQIDSDAEADREQMPSVALELYDEVITFRLKVASLEQHIEEQNSVIEGTA